MLQCVVVGCSVSQCVVVGCSVSQCVVVGCSVSQCVLEQNEPYKKEALSQILGACKTLHIYCGVL